MSEDRDEAPPMTAPASAEAPADGSGAESSLMNGDAFAQAVAASAAVLAGMARDGQLAKLVNSSPQGWRRRDYLI